jgi:GntR family transcriptional regulator
MAGYREIAAQLRDAIDRGQYPPGARIPTEYELAERYGVSRETVRRALALLKSEGRLAAATSRGTYVPPAPVRLAIARYSTVLDPQRSRSDLGPWETACAEQGINGRTELVAVTTEPADEHLAARLGVQVGAELVHRARRMWADDQVAQLQDTWMPAELAAGTPLAAPEKIVGGVYAYMRSAGFGPARVTEEVDARMPTSDELDSLSEGAPVLDIWRTTYDRAARIVELLHTVASGRYSTLVYDDLPIEQSER